jgi:hypothetical protein
MNQNLNDLKKYKSATKRIGVCYNIYVECGLAPITMILYKPSPQYIINYALFSINNSTHLLSYNSSNNSLIYLAHSSMKPCAVLNACQNTYTPKIHRHFPLPYPKTIHTFILLHRLSPRMSAPSILHYLIYMNLFFAAPLHSLLLDSKKKNSPPPNLQNIYKTSFPNTNLSSITPILLLLVCAAGTYHIPQPVGAFLLLSTRHIHSQIISPKSPLHLNSLHTSKSYTSITNPFNPGFSSIYTCPLMQKIYSLSLT